MTRTATLDDIPALVEMGRQFHGMSPHHFIGGYDADGITNVLRFMINSPQSLVLTNGEGLIGGTFAPVYFSPSKLMLEENFLWAARGGMQLLVEFERLGRSLGASFVLMSTLENDRVLTMDRVMKRSGYLPIERRYLKELS